MGPTNENPQNPTYIKQTGSLPVLRTVKSTVEMTCKTETQLARRSNPNRPNSRAPPWISSQNDQTVRSS